MLPVISAAALAVGVLMGTLFVIAVIIRRNDIVDIFWGPGIFLVTLVAYVMAPQPNNLNALLVILTAFWAFRLGWRIFKRNHGPDTSEDKRYAAWREDWGKWVHVRAFFQIYLLQGSLMLVLGASAILASVKSESFQELGTLTYIGIAVWLIGYYFEVVGDKQLADFIAKKKRDETDKEVMDEGLWRYTRHPNYFGEVTMWWGIWLMVASLPSAYVALISPVTITFLILYVSGVPMLERRYEGDPAYEAYKKRTSKFIPLPPKSTD